MPTPCLRQRCVLGAAAHGATRASWAGCGERCLGSGGEALPAAPLPRKHGLWGYCTPSPMCCWTACGAEKVY